MSLAAAGIGLDAAQHLYASCLAAGAVLGAAVALFNSWRV